ncbi:MAG: hypothetical protein ACOX6T_19140 [Myxococcales bacterium]|jgi:hypothetical protein
MRSKLLLIALLALAACGGSSDSSLDAGQVPDAQSEAQDSGTHPADASADEPDARLPEDAGLVEDAGLTDDAGLADDAGLTDDAGLADDAGLPPQTEQEPNDGASETEVNPFAPPGAITGAIDPAADIDILKLELRAGDVWVWTLAPQAQSLAPHLAVFEAADVVPDLVAIGAAGETVEQEQLVLADGLWYAAVRDERNVSGSASVGGPGFTWRLDARAETRAPTPISFPSTVAGALRHRFAIALYSFHADADFAFDIDLRADRKSPRSDMDSRLSLYNATTRRWVHTNDDQSGTTTDSHIGGDGLSAGGEYWLLVENVNPVAGDLSFELVLTLRR